MPNGFYKDLKGRLMIMGGQGGYRNAKQMSREKAIELSAFQVGKLKEALKGFCYDANPSEWPDRNERKQMELLVENGLMEKLKNHSGDKYGFYSITEKGKQALKVKTNEQDKD